MSSEEQNCAEGSASRSQDFSDPLSAYEDAVLAMLNAFHLVGGARCNDSDGYKTSAESLVHNFIEAQRRMYTKFAQDQAHFVLNRPDLVLTEEISQLRHDGDELKRRLSESDQCVRNWTQRLDDAAQRQPTAADRAQTQHTAAAAAEHK